MSLLNDGFSIFSEPPYILIKLFRYDTKELTITTMPVRINIMFVQPGRLKYSTSQVPPQIKRSSGVIITKAI